MTAASMAQPATAAPVPLDYEDRELLTLLERRGTAGLRPASIALSMGGKQLRRLDRLKKAGLVADLTVGRWSITSAGREALR